MPIMSSIFRLLLITICALPLMDVQVNATSLSGKASYGDRPASGVVVAAFPVSSISLAGKAPHQSEMTGEDGLFAIELPPGQYYLLANGKDLFSYYGRNPLSVPEEGLAEINLMMVESGGKSPRSEVYFDSGVVGTVTHNGKPVSGASMSVYTDLSSHLKGFGFGASPPTDESGYFELPLDAGTYYLVVRLRQSGEFAGPLRAGDLFGYYPLNPLSLKVGEVSRIIIPLIEVPAKVEKFASTLFGETTISGTIVDVDGKPLPGMRALLYTDSSMLNRPEYVSRPTGSDGKFVLSFPQGGTYFLAARDQLGGTPAPGELYGRFAGSEDGSLTVKDGKTVEGVKIIVEEVW